MDTEMEMQRKLEKDMLRRRIKALKHQLALANDHWRYLMAQRVRYERNPLWSDSLLNHSDVIMSYKSDIAIVEATIASLNAQISALEQQL